MFINRLGNLFNKSMLATQQLLGPQLLQLQQNFTNWSALTVFHSDHYYEVKFPNPLAILASEVGDLTTTNGICGSSK